MNNIPEDIIIIGKGNNKRKLKEPTHFNTLDEVIKIYGESDLADAFKICKDFKINNIWLCNTFDVNDYIELSKNLQDRNFTYIVPINLFLSDKYNIFTINKTRYYYRTMIENMQNYNNSIIISTTNHASLYKDIDSFINDINKDIINFKNDTIETTRLDNIQLVANNLKKYKYANVVLACMYLQTDISEYPTYDNLGSTIFDIDNFDMKNDCIYFKTLGNGVTIVENLLNLHKETTPIKICYIDRILRYIKNGLMLNNFCGQLYNKYKLSLVRKKIEIYFDSLIDYIIEDYNIDLIDCYSDELHPGTVIIIANITIIPKNCLERLSFKIYIK